MKKKCVDSLEEHVEVSGSSRSLMKKKCVDSLEEHVEVSGSSRSLAEGRHKQPRKSHLGRKHNTASA
jgi:hypothetical protein